MSTETHDGFCNLIIEQVDQHKEASDLGWKPGEWPKKCFLGGMVNIHCNLDSDVMYVDYMDYNNEILTRVFND